MVNCVSFPLLHEFKPYTCSFGCARVVATPLNSVAKALMSSMVHCEDDFPFNFITAGRRTSAEMTLSMRIDAPRVHQIFKRNSSVSKTLKILFSVLTGLMAESSDLKDASREFQISSSKSFPNKAPAISLTSASVQDV